MGQCVSDTRPPRDELAPASSPEGLDIPDLGIGHRYARPASPSLAQRGAKPAVTPPVDYSREEARLRDLFSALRTGLVFTETEFSVLPGVSTTAKVVFSIGSSTVIEQSAREAAQRQEDKSVGSEGEEDEGEDEVYELRVSLYGGAWTQGLRMQLTVWPIVGLLAGRKLVFIWSENILRVLGCRAGEINARALPVSFDSETVFCRCCLQLAYHSDLSGNLHTEEIGETPPTSDGLVPSLSSLSYHAAVTNLDAVPEALAIPLKVSHMLYGSQKPVTISIRVWPNSYAGQFSTNPVMKVKAGLVFSEFVYLLKEHFHLPSKHTVKLYHNYKPVQMSEQVTHRFKTLDCFVISYEGDDLSGSFGSGMEEDADSHATLVVSLVGYDVQNIEANLEMKLRDFDGMLRKRFKLKNDSFLIILAEDDFAPQYTTCDNWKCIFPFTLPETSFSAGLRRSFRKLSRRQRVQENGSYSSQGGRAASREPFISDMEKVIELLSSSSRHFPSKGDRFDFSLEELYETMPMYQLSLERCGIHPYAIIQVFEVTGPSIPMKFRILSDHSRPKQPTGQASGSTSELPRVSRHANIMDVNPKWSIHTFLQYVDAVISPASGVRQKRVILKDRSIEDSEDLSTLTLGELLDLWKPAWWHRVGARRQLTVKDIDPAEFLLVEKYSTSSHNR